jgi:hypothetical protein
LSIGSATYAIKAKKLLLRESIPSKLIKTNGESISSGCNHALEIDSNHFYAAVAVLRKNGITYSVWSE